MRIVENNLLEMPSSRVFVSDLANDTCFTGACSGLLQHKSAQGVLMLLLSHYGPRDVACSSCHHTTAGYGTRRMSPSGHRRLLSLPLTWPKKSTSVIIPIQPALLWDSFIPPSRDRDVWACLAEQQYSCPPALVLERHSKV